MSNETCCIEESQYLKQQSNGHQIFLLNNFHQKLPNVISSIDAE
jgi:hypothetical protein